MSYFVSRYLLGFAILLSLGLFALAYFNGWNLELAVFLGTLLVVFIGLLAEKLLPYWPDWNRSKGDVKTDLVSAVVLVAIIDPALKVVGPIIVVFIYDWLELGYASYLSGMPLLAQIVFVTLLVEFGRYWSHRLHHVIESLWWLHAMHHSSKRLYVINNLRFHPLNYVLNFFIGLFPVLVLAPASEALLAYLALSQPILMLQHANIDLKSGWLNYVFSTNELHRWHHSTDTAKANSNYGNAIVLWDQIFGTFKIESVQDTTEPSIGLFESSRNYPADAGYFKQILRSGYNPLKSRKR